MEQHDQPPRGTEKEYKPNEFYIGWMAKAPAGFAQFAKKYVLVIYVAAIILGTFLAGWQKKFGTGNFEAGTLTQIKGVYRSKPMPCITVANGSDIFGNGQYTTIPLVGYGKFGADGIMAGIKKQMGVSLDGKRISLSGTLLYNDGKALLQVDGNDKPVTDIGKNPDPSTFTVKVLGNVTVKGEIIDPKCYFGVMKPGEGKPHEDCAIRCILGGIPPMLHAIDGKGASNYYLIVGPNGEKMNTNVKNYVAQPVEIKAKAVQFNNWIVLYVADTEGIQSISKSSFFQPVSSLIACSSDKCK